MKFLSNPYFCIPLAFLFILPPLKTLPQDGESSGIRLHWKQTPSNVQNPSVQMIITDEEEHAEVIANLSSTLNKILENYDNRFRPNFYGPPLPIEVRMILRGIASVSEIDMQFESDFYLHQMWNDSRLRFTPPRPLNYITLDKKSSSVLWQPDTYFSSEKNSHLHSATVDNEFFRWYPSGSITKSLRLTLMSTCLMNLEHFPMDQQICSMEMGSYGMTASDVNYNWMKEDTISLGPNAGKLLPHFLVTAYRVRKRTLKYFSGDYTYLVVDFLFIRSMTYYLIDIYIPAILVVIISWFAFWMGSNAGAERMALGVTSLLTITTLLLSAHSSAPKISYVKAIDIYAGACYAMVFASLFQSAVICFAWSRLNLGGVKAGKTADVENADGSMGESKTQKKFSNGYDNFKFLNSKAALWTETKEGLQHFDIRDKYLRFRSISLKSGIGDRACRVLFPTMFVVFNVVYWAYYLNVSPIKLDGQWSQISDS